MLPFCSSMHFVNCWVAPAQLLPHWEVVWDSAPAATGEADWAWAGASEEPPEKRPPMAWPTEEPMATPLKGLLAFCHGLCSFRAG